MTRATRRSAAISDRCKYSSHPRPRSIAGRAVQAHRACRGCHAAIYDPGRARENEHLICGGVAGAVGPGFAFGINVNDASLLNDRFYPTARAEAGIQHFAGADSIMLARICSHDAGFWRAVDRSKL